MIRKLFAGLVFLAFSTAAFGSSCPLYMSDIDAALADPAVQERLSEEQLSQARKLRDKGEKTHRSGEHDKSMEALGRAKEILGIA